MLGNASRSIESEFQWCSRNGKGGRAIQLPGFDGFEQVSPANGHDHQPRIREEESIDPPLYVFAIRGDRASTQAVRAFDFSLYGRVSRFFRPDVDVRRDLGGQRPKSLLSTDWLKFNFLLIPTILLKTLSEHLGELVQHFHQNRISQKVFHHTVFPKPTDTPSILAPYLGTPQKAKCL